MNDYVRAVEYVDANGEYRTISDPNQLKAAAGCFGLLGVVTHITFELDKMQYAILKPIKPDIGLAIPPLSRDDIPVALRKTFTDAQYKAALEDFENRANNDYYSEWFWFTRSQQAWVNTWNPTDDKTGVVEYPSPFATWMQWVEGWLGSVITTNPIFNALPGRWQAEVLATIGMVNLPPFGFSSFGQTQVEEKNIIKTAIPNGLHFRRGVCLILFPQSVTKLIKIFRSKICVAATWNSRSQFLLTRMTRRNQITALYKKLGGILSISLTRLPTVLCASPWNCVSWAAQNFLWHLSTATPTALLLLKSSVFQTLLLTLSGSPFCSRSPTCG